MAKYRWFILSGMEKAIREPGVYIQVWPPKHCKISEFLGFQCADMQSWAQAQELMGLWRLVCTFLPPPLSFWRQKCGQNCVHCIPVWLQRPYA